MMADDPTVSRSTEGPEQDILGEITDLANSIQRAPGEWSLLVDDVLRLKQKAIDIGAMIHKVKSEAE